MVYQAPGYLLTEAGEKILLELGYGGAVRLDEATQTGPDTTVQLVTEAGEPMSLESSDGVILVEGLSAAVAQTENFEDEMVLPDFLALGCSTGAAFGTKIVEVREGEFGRVSELQHARVIGQLNLLDAPYEDAVDLLSFHRAVRGSHIGWRLLDPNDHSTHHEHVGLPDASDYRHRHLIGGGDGATTQFQLRKRYSTPRADDGTPAVIRWYPITRPVRATRPVRVSPFFEADPNHAMHIFVDGVEQTEGAVNDYTVDYAGGLVTFTTEPAVGTSIEWAGTFHTPVRFGQSADRLPANLLGAELVSLPSLPIIGVPESVTMSDHRWIGGYYVEPTNITRDYAIQLSWGFAQSLPVTAPGVTLYCPEAAQLVDGGPHMLIHNSGTTAAKVEAYTVQPGPNTAETFYTVVTSLAATQWCFLSIDNSGNWFAHV